MSNEGFAILAAFVEASRLKYLAVGKGQPFDADAYNAAYRALFEYIKRAEAVSL